MKKTYLTVFFILSTLAGMAQVGIGTTTPQAALDVTATDMGMLVPRIALTDTQSAAPVSNPESETLVNGTLIYNTATAGTAPGNVVPGFYYWQDSAWVAVKGGATLDAAYDGAGAGAGRVITADAGTVEIIGEGGLLVSGNLDSSLGLLLLGIEGSHMYFNPGKGAFRAGYIDDASSWSNSNVGQYSTAFGANTIASGYNSTAFGGSTSASGNYSFASGYGSTATGNLSIASGNLNNASGHYSTASGNSSVASGEYSTAAGNNATASGQYSTALGEYTTASGDYSTAAGSTTIASGTLAIATGAGSQATAFSSTANGYNTRAFASYSTALGRGTTARSISEFVIGQYNTDYTPFVDTNYWFEQDRLFVIGNGQESYLKSDALIVYKNGNLTIGGSNAVKPGGGNWVGTSDSRLKQEVKQFKDGLAQVLAIKPVTYHYNELSGLDTSKEYVGVIAQELQKVAPYMVGNFTKDGTDYLNVDSSAMTYMLINAVKEQQEIIEKQNRKIEEQNNALTAQNNRLESLEKTVLSLLGNQPRPNNEIVKAE